MFLLLQHLAGTIAGNAEFEEELLALPEKGATVLDTYRGPLKDIIDTSVFNKFVYLGQGPFYGLACEGMLKMKEMSLSFSEAYHTLEFRHGPMSIVDEDMLIIFFISEHARAEELALLKEMKRLGAKTLVITEAADIEIQKAANYMVELKSGLSDYARLILYMPVVQLLGYYTAVAKGLDPDKPKNLTQVVVLDSDTSLSI